MKIPKFVNIFKVQINYKSGISVISDFRKFDGETKGTEVVSLDWLAISLLLAPLVQVP